MNPFEKRTKKIFKELKNAKRPRPISLWNGGRLLTINKGLSQEQPVYEQMARWRSESNFAFPSQVPITIDGFRKWLKDYLIDKPDRILFMVVNDRDEFVGHLGLNSFDFENETCEIDNVIRGENISPGIMSHALQALIRWAKDELEVKQLYLRVFNDNIHAMTYYMKNGFDKHSFVPLEKHVVGDTVIWRESETNIERHFMRMIYTGG